MFYFAENANNINWDMWGVIVPAIIFVASTLATAIGVYFRLKGVEKAIDKDVKPDLKSLRAKIDSSAKDLGARIDTIHTTLLTLKLEQSGAVEGNSPRALTTKGEKILNESGVKDIVDARLGEIITYVKDKNPENEYRAEQYVIEAVREFGKDQGLKDTIEEGAFNSGTTVDVVLFVGAIYVRDQVLAAIEQMRNNGQ